jgi:hypothetical protein
VNNATNELALLGSFLPFHQIIGSKRRVRRNNPRRGAAKASIIGTKATAVAPVAARTKVAAAGGVPTEKIIVSNLPIDVTEAQIRVGLTSTICGIWTNPFFTRNCFRAPLDL